MPIPMAMAASPPSKRHCKEEESGKCVGFLFYSGIFVLDRRTGDVLPSVGSACSGSTKVRSGRRKRFCIMCSPGIWRLSALTRRGADGLLWVSELCAGEMLRLAGCRSGRGVCARGGWRWGSAVLLRRWAFDLCPMLRFCWNALRLESCLLFDASAKQRRLCVIFRSYSARVGIALVRSQRTCLSNGTQACHVPQAQ